MQIIDVNHKYGYWTVIERNRNRTWRCRCHCGTEQNIPEAWLLSGFSKSCGCRKSKAKDLRQQRFGRLIAIGPVAEKNPDGSIRWRCICDCGNETVVSSNHLLQSHTTSCGCQTLIAAREGKTHIDGTCLEILFTPTIRANNTSGHTGVYKKRSKWIAYITVARKRYYLGSYEDFDEAVAARRKAEEEWMEKLLGKQDSEISELLDVSG